MAMVKGPAVTVGTVTPHLQARSLLEAVYVLTELSPTDLPLKPAYLSACRHVTAS